MISFIAMQYINIIVEYWQPTKKEAEARSIGMHQELPLALKEMMEQSYAYRLQLGPSKSSTIPKFHGLVQMPEDNDALNQFWGCIYQKKGIINDDNEVNSHKLHEYLMGMFTIFTTANDMLRKLADDITETCKAMEADEYPKRCLRIENCITREVKVSFSG